MHAIRQHEVGPPDVLRLAEVDDPTPASGQVRVVVRAAGVHLVDTAIRAGTVGSRAAPPALPMTPGREVAGTVDLLGDGVDETWRGARVVVHLGTAGGGYAELAVADVTSLHRLPEGLDEITAVAMMGTGRMTVGVLTLARLREHDVALVTSAAGGIGTLVVQAARAAGAFVVGLAGGPDKTRRVRENGADVAVDYTTPDWADDVRRQLGDRPPTVAFDGVGADVGRAVFDLLGPGGRTLLYGFSGGGPTDFTSAELVARSLTAIVALGPPILRLPGGLRGLEEQALAAAASRELVPAVTTFTLADAAAAHAALENRSAVGKVVLVA